jgi:drug/metabolite transporter (DMT)-like permease
VRILVRRYHVDLLLVGVAAVWGLTFVTVKDAVAQYPPFSFMAIRFALAVLVIALLFPRAFRRVNRRVIGAGVLAGLVLSVGYVGQTLGLMTIEASRAGFITGTFVVITPLLQFLVLKRRVRPWVLVGVVLASVGLWLLTSGDGGGWQVGDSLTLLAATGFSAHMIVLGAVSKNHPVETLTLVQMMTVTVLTAVVAVFIERPLTPPATADVWWALAITGVLASAAAFWIQTYAQRHISPTRTALILINEPVFAGIFGFWLLGERLGILGWIGSGLIFAGMLTSEIAGNLHRAKEPLPIDA